MHTRTYQGDLITHAHPYSSDGDSPVDPGHSHSEQGYEFLDLINFSEYIHQIILLGIGLIFLTIREDIYGKGNAPVLSYHHSKKSGRGPPNTFPC